MICRTIAEKALIATRMYSSACIPAASQTGCTTVFTTVSGVANRRVCLLLLLTNCRCSARGVGDDEKLKACKVFDAQAGNRCVKASMCTQNGLTHRPARQWQPPPLPHTPPTPTHPSQS